MNSVPSARSLTWKAFINGKITSYREAYRKRLTEWRKQGTVVRVQPTRIERARALGYKKKPGFVVVRVRVRKGHPFKVRPRAGRRPKRMGIRKITYAISDRLIAENRALKRYRNLRLMGSYLAGEDGQQKWFEVVMREP
ncbi:MAG: 50S ribosomal protein L15 [Candidatus Marsarchaeota archaeon]|nr:50S ribosomal protein L15 [Candidatus Marsarchaeota archaeon]